MLDKDIRKVILPKLMELPTVTAPTYVEEWHVARRVIADVVGISMDGLTGFEIKSDSDNLSRLANQVKAYDKVCRHNYVVVGVKYQDKITPAVPEHWGIICVTDEGMQLIREAQRNEAIDLRSLFWVLWREEMVNLLRRKKIRGYSKLRMWQLGRLAVSKLEPDIVEQYVYETLLNRQSWKIQGR